MSTGPDSQLLSALIGRVVEKLPINSGLTPAFLESDIVFRQNIASILDVAPFKVHEIIGHVLSALEKIESNEAFLHSATLTNNTSAEVPTLTLNLLYSCLILNRLLSHCFAQCWKFGKPSTASAQKTVLSKLTTHKSSSPASRSSVSSSISRNMSIPKMSKPSGISFSIGTTSTASSQLSSSTLHVWSEPPPLDDTAVNYISFHTIRLYMTSIFANVSLDTISHSYTAPSKTTGIFLPETYSHSQFFRFFLSQDRTTEDLLASVVSVPSMTCSSLWADIERATGQLIYYISAANWNLMITVFTSKLQAVKTSSNSVTTALLQGSMDQLSPGEDTVYDFMMMQCFHLNRLKLSALLKKIVASIKQFSKKALICLCVSLRRAIWSWIEAHPLEFSNLNQERKNLDGQPEVIFDHIYTVSDASKKKHLYWPTLVPLLLLSAEDLFTYTTSGGGTVSFGKKGPFLEHLRKMLKSRNPDVALYCYIEICKAGTFVNKKDSAALRILISGFETELKEKLFDPSKPLSFSSEEGLLDEHVFVESISSFFKLNPLNTIRSVYPSLLSSTSPSTFKLAFIRSCTILVTEETNLPWNPPIDSSLADHIRNLFLDSVGRDKPTGARKASHGKILSEKEKKSKKIGLDDSERSQIILNCLFDWSACPPLVVAREQLTISENEFKAVLTGITHCLFDGVSEIRYFASRVLLRVLGFDFIPRWDGTVPDWNGSTESALPTEESMKLFWKVSSFILLSISRPLLDILVSDGNVEVRIVSEILTLCGQLLLSRNEYLKQASKYIPAISGANASERFLASVSMEVSFLVLLSSTETDLAKEAIQCLHHLVQEADITGESVLASQHSMAKSESRLLRFAKSRSFAFSDENMGNRTLIPKSQAQSTHTSPINSNLSLNEPSTPRDRPQEMQAFSVVDNIAVYRELYSLIYGSVGSSIMSNKGLQKHIRRLLRTANRTTLGNMAAWEEVYRKWKNQYCVTLKLSSTSVGVGDVDEEEKVGNKRHGKGAPMKPQTESVTGMGDEQAEWYNYTGLLCAMGHICLGANPAQIRNGKADSVYGSIPARTVSMESESSTLDQVLAHNHALNDINGGSSFQAAMRQQIASSFGSAKHIVDRFIWELGEFLLHDSVVIRESVKELFGCELSAVLYNNLFNFFDKALLSILANNQSEICSDRNTLFVDHVTTILKLVLDRADELFSKQVAQGDMGGRQGSITHLSPFSLDFGTLIMHIVQYLIYLTAIPSQNQTAIKAKVRLCNVLQVLLQKKSLVGIKNDVAFQNYMVEILLEWNSEFHTKVNETVALSIDPSGKPQNELDSLTMRVMSSLLQNLPLRLVSGTNGQLEMQEGSVEIRAKIFSKFLSFFLKILHTVKVADNFENVRAVQSSANSDFRQFLAKSKDALAHLSKLKEYTITAMANLIAANVDIGLKYSLSLAYHDDLKTRATFLQVLAGILHDGAGVKEPGTLGGEEDSKLTLYTKFLDIICDEDLLVVRGICSFVNQSDVDEVANLLFPIFQSRGKCLLLLSRVLEEEIQKTDTEANLFRRNSLATKLLTLYASSEGQSFLESSLGPILDTLCHSDREISYEIDPSKLQPGESLEQNLQRLRNTTQAFIDSILGSHDLFPKNLRAVCSIIFEFAGERFPGAELNGVGGFVFLRFICPSIVAPESHGLVKRGSLGREARRCLILVTKVIQNLANNVLFGNKEAFMVEMNSVVQENEARIHSFLKELSAFEQNSDDRRLLETAIVGSDADVLKLHRFIESSLSKLEKAMASTVQTESPLKSSKPHGEGRKLLRANSDKDPNTAETVVLNDTFTLKKKAFDELSLILVQLGPVATAEEIARAARRKSLQRITDSSHSSVMLSDSSQKAPANRHFVEFMKKYDLVSTKSREIEKLKEMDIIYQAGTDLENHPVLVFACHKLKAEQIDPTMFMYYALTKFGSLLSGPFGVIVDLTLFSAVNEWGLEAILELEKIFPTDGKTNMKYLIFLFPNHAFKQHAKKASRILHPRFFKNILFAQSTADLKDYMALDQVLLPKLALSVSEASALKFTGLLLNNVNRNSIPVSISVSSHTFQIFQEKKQDLLGWQVTLVDTFHLTDIVDVGPQVNAKTGADTEFFIKLHEGDHDVNGESIGSRGPMKSFVFTSDKRDIILQTVRSAIARFQLSKPTILSDKDVYLSPRDHPETILNIAFLNMGTDDPYLRVVSFNLLSSVLSSFGYLNGEFFLENAKGLAIPMNNFRFVRTISSKLAESEKSLTVDLIYECIQGFTKYDRDLKHHAIQYLAPWIPNLAAIISGSQGYLEKPEIGDKRHKIYQVIQALLNLTLKEKDVFFEIQEMIWAPLSQLDQSVSVIIDFVIDNARDYSLVSQEIEIIGNTLITMSSTNISAVAGKLLDKIKTTLESRLDPAHNYIVDMSCWKDVTILLRFVMLLSFDNRLNIAHFLPDLFFLLSMLVGLGAPVIRRTVYAIIVNVVQSFSISASRHETRVSGLQLILARLMDPRFNKLFANSVTSQSITMENKSRELGSQAFNMSTDAVMGDVVKDVSLVDVESFLNLLLDIMSYAAPTADTLCTWKTRWVSLSAKAAFEPNVVMQARSFLCLGCLSKDSFDGELLYQCLVALRTSLLKLEDSTLPLTLSIITCISHVMAGIPSIEGYIAMVFWLAVALLQVANEAIYLKSLNLFLVALDLIEKEPRLRGSALTSSLLNGREPFAGNAVKLDQQMHVLFSDEYFGFSVTAVLLYGLHHPSTRKLTHRVLMRLLELNCQTSSDQVWWLGDLEASKTIWGYLMPLLPTSENLEDVLAASRVSLETMEEPFSLIPVDFAGQSKVISTLLDTLFSLFPFEDTNLAVICMITLHNLLTNTDSEAESLIIYKLYAKFAEKTPQAFSLIYPSLAKNFSTVISSSKTSYASESVHEIFKLLASRSRQEKQDHHRDILERTGFMGLLAIRSFNDVSKESKLRRVHLVCDIIDLILSSLF